MTPHAAETIPLKSTAAQPVYAPKAPTKPEELDIPVSLVDDMMMRYLFTKASSSIKELAQSLKLPFSLLHSVFQRLRDQQYFEITGMEGNDYIFTLSGTGRDIASKRFAISHYAGPAPVAMKTYEEAVRSQAVDLQINPNLLKEALKDLVLTGRFLDQLGPALASQKSIFLYGPTGNGKTSVVSRLFRIYRDAIVIPHAVEVDGQIIVLYDPAVHEKIECDTDGLDQRWVVCRRPCIIVGGELEPGMLELQLEESTKVYAAPMQMRANNGMLVIDDFGRQIVSPVTLLNRWIVPLDRRVDYLTLRYGLKFEIPFEMIVVFSTNLDPNDLADEAFLRRIHNKIYVEAVDAKVFDRIFRSEADKRQIPYHENSSAILSKLCLHMGPNELRACYPADILDILTATSAYQGQPPEVNPESLKRAVLLYFTKPKAPPAESG